MSDTKCKRCTAMKSDGKRCKRNTCKYGQGLCWQHTQLKFHLKVKKSGIPQADQGLFTTRAFKKNEDIIGYTGALVDAKSFNDNSSHYGLRINKDTVLDARSTQSSIARYANDCRSSNKKGRQCSGNNARFVVNPKKRTAKLRATKNIPANSEVFVSYGNAYW